MDNLETKNYILKGRRIKFSVLLIYSLQWLTSIIV